MADIRINALATTATTPASDDYLALDGTAQGTRKILATNIANNVTDVILGSSGPSVKSSLSARAPRQGLVFDGTAGATVSVPAFGTGNFTATAWVNVSSLGTLGIFGGATNAFGYYVDNTGLLVAQKRGVALILSSTSTIPANKFVLVTYTRSGTTGTHYFNGVAINSGTDSTDYSVGITSVGSLVSSTNPFNGAISGALIYNRALSASEVVALYEAGAPAGADYNSASNTRINQATVVNGNSGAGLTYNTFSGASATGFTAVKNQTSAESNVYSGEGYTVSSGQQFLVTFSCTLNSGTLPYLFISDWAGSPLYNSAPRITAGSNSIVITVNKTGTGARLRFYSPTSELVDYAISNLSVTRLGLLLAPDAAQAGGGLVWYDTSGNAANITLPASGVSWNVPSSRVLGGDWTNTGTLTVSGTGPSSFAGRLSISSTTGVGLQTALAVSSSSGLGVFTDYTKTSGTSRTWSLGATGSSSSAGDNAFALYDGTAAAFRFLVTSGGNYLIGTTTDGGQKLQVSGTAQLYTSNGQVNIAPESTTAQIQALRVSADATLRLTRSAVADWDFVAGTDLVIKRNNTTALTLSGSDQSATFAGTVKSAVATGGRTLQATPSVTVAQDAVQNLVTQNYGFFLISEVSITGSIAIIGFNAGGTYLVWQEGTNYSTTINTASKFNVYYSSGNQLVVQNKKTGSASFNIINLAGGS